MKKPLTLICREKTKFILLFFLKILQRYWKLIVLSILGMPGKKPPKWYYHLAKNLCVYLQQNIDFIPHALFEILQRYANFLFWVLWACLVAHTQNDSINLCKTSMFICMQKTNFIIHFCLDILYFKESCNLIGWSAIWLKTGIFPDMRSVVKYQQQY